MDNVNKEDIFNNLYRRSERVVAAVFLVAEKMSDSTGGLKTRIRQISVELISSILNLKNDDLEEVKESLAKSNALSMEIMALLNVASMAGIVSDMNADILRKEFDLLLIDLKSFYNKFEIIPTSFLRKIMLERGEMPRKIEDKLFIKANNPRSTNISPLNGSITDRKSTRKNVILSFISKNPDVGIKDILPNVRGCSEKTIQRELIELIKEDKIVKSGERRWSKYKVANQFKM